MQEGDAGRRLDAQGNRTSRMGETGAIAEDVEPLSGLSLPAVKAVHDEEVFERRNRLRRAGFAVVLLVMAAVPVLIAIETTDLAARATLAAATAVLLLGAVANATATESEARRRGGRAVSSLVQPTWKEQQLSLSAYRLALTNERLRLHIRDLGHSPRAQGDLSWVRELRDEVDALTRAIVHEDIPNADREEVLEVAAKATATVADTDALLHLDLPSGRLSDASTDK